MQFAVVLVRVLVIDPSQDGTITSTALLRGLSTSTKEIVAELTERWASPG